MYQRASWVRVLISFSVGSLLALPACGETDSTAPDGPSPGFYARLKAGAECPELFDLRNELDPKDPEIPKMNERLREIGCYSSTSERTD